VDLIERDKSWHVNCECVTLKNARPHVYLSGTVNKFALRYVTFVYV
jgi:hypothetical protein